MEDGVSVEKARKDCGRGISAHCLKTSIMKRYFIEDVSKFKKIYHKKENHLA